MASLLLAPIGPVDPDLLPWLGERLEEALGRPWAVGPVVPLPATSYDRRRQQYLSDDLLALLQRMPAPGGTWRILGIVEADLYTPGLNFVFGQASLAGPAALVALARLHPSFYGLLEDEQCFRERVLKEAVHELGHTLGLRHCADRRCVMHFSNTLADTDFKGAHFCPACVRKAGM